MALDYDLRVCTSLDVSQIRNLLPTLAAGLKTSQASGTIVGTGVVISVSPESELGKQITKENYGLESTALVSFRLDKFDGFEEGLKTTVKISLSLLRAAECDGLLLSNDIPVLMRKEGKIVVNSGPGFWPGLPLLVGQPHTIASLSAKK